MSRINFKEFTVYTDIAHKQRQTGDARETFADMIYRYVGGIKAHALAFRIYESGGEEEYSEEEVSIIRRVAEEFCLSGFIDGLYEQLNINRKKED